MSGFFLNLDLHFKSKEKASWKFQLVLSSYTKPIHLLTHLQREREGGYTRNYGGFMLS